jgi:flagellar hook-associated protein 3 FlgL
LVNQSVDGEYIFAGSDTTIRPFVEDPDTGRIEYKGDAQLRNVAVDVNTYRDRGITGFDAIMYTASKGTTGNPMTFTEGDRIIDNDGLEWIAPAATAGHKLTFDTGDTLIDNNNDTWTLQDTDSDGVYDNIINGTTSETIAVEKVGDTLYQTAAVDSALSAGTLEYLAVDSDTGTAGLQLEMRQLDRYGDLSTETPRSVTMNAGTLESATDPYTFTIADVGGDNRVMEAKHSFFDDLDTIITALETNTNDRDTVNDIKGLRETLDMIDDEYNAANIGHSVLGARNKIFENALDSVSSRLTHFNILYQEVAGADLSKVAMEAKALEMQYTGLYSTISKMNELTLVNFVR